MSERFKFYTTQKEDRPSHSILEYLQQRLHRVVLVNKSLNVALAGTGVGKSLFMCHVASSVSSSFKEVTFSTLRLRWLKKRIAERIDANLLNVPIQEISKSTQTVMFENRR